jgi:hypothetical protein
MDKITDKIKNKYGKSVVNDEVLKWNILNM